MKLEEHKGRGIEGYNKTCKLCGEEEEDLVHFVSRCKKLEPVRDYNLLDRDIRDPEDRMRKLLYRDDRSWRVGKLIKDLWDLRRKLLKEIEKPTRGTLPQKTKKKTKGTKVDSGSRKTKVQRNRGPGPPVLTTQGCIGTRQKKITLRRKNRADH